MKKLAKICGDRRGATIYIAMGLSLLILVATMSVATMIKNTSESIEAFNNKFQAQMKADSIREQLLLAMKGHEAGWTVEGDDCAEAIGFVKGEIGDDFEVSCEVIGRSVDSVEGVYIVPTPGTGSAGSTCVNSEDMDDLDDACNWGTMEKGNSLTRRVVVPLYYENADNQIVNLVESGSDFRLQIKLRTPCDPSFSEEESCHAEDRYQLDPGSYPWTVDTDETVINWEISGTCPGVGSCSLVPWNGKKVEPIRRDYTQDSHIFERLIVEKGIGNDYIMIDAKELELLGDSFDNRDKRGQVRGLNSDPITIRAFLAGEIGGRSLGPVENPVLTLSIVTDKLETSAQENVPYMEYQISTNEPIASSSYTMKITVRYKGQIFSMEESIEQEKDVVDFAIQN